jgi:hypothetical protein
MMKLALPPKLSFPALGLVFLASTLLVMFQASYQVSESIGPMSVIPTDEPMLAPKTLSKHAD